MRPARLIAAAAVTALCLTASADPQWRSELYPKDWKPPRAGVTGKFLHDFSYAGYHQGARDVPHKQGPVVDVARRGADLSGKADATAVIQTAIDELGKRGGGVVFLPKGTYRIDGVLLVRRSGVVLRGAGHDATRLRFTRSAKMSNKGHITLAGKVKSGAELMVASDTKVAAAQLTLASVSGLAVGDHIHVGWVITDAFRAAHGMQAYWKFSAGKWRPFFRRRITKIEAAARRITVDVPLRYDVLTRDKASVRKVTGHLTECGVESLSVCNATTWDTAWSLTRVQVIQVRGARDCWVRGVRSFASEDPAAKGAHLTSGGIKVLKSKNVTITDCQLARPQHRGGGGNGYLYEISGSNEVLIDDCTATSGRHNFIQNWDFGTSGCVFTRTRSRGGRVLMSKNIPMGMPGFSEYHHALAMANLVDDSEFDDGWSAINRKTWSSGAGHTATGCVFWNLRGRGLLRSRQFGMGYVIGTTGEKMTVDTTLNEYDAQGTAPRDHVEGVGKGESLEPASLYRDQRKRRLGR